jgi:hypothetical protein
MPQPALLAEVACVEGSQEPQKIAGDKPAALAASPGWNFHLAFAEYWYF